MKKTLVVSAIAAFCGSAAVTGLALTATKADRKQPEMQVAPDHPLAAIYAQAMDPAAGEAAWMEAMTPGPAHEWMRQFVGKWKATMTMNMGGQEMESHGTSEFAWLMDGRFIKHTFTGDMMGQPWTGFGVMGFDNIKRQYVEVWMDSMGTGIMQMQGSLDPSAKVMTMVGNMDEPMTGEHGKAVLFITTILDENHMRFEAKEILYGEPFVAFTVNYERIR